MPHPGSMASPEPRSDPTMMPDESIRVAAAGGKRFPRRFLAPKVANSRVRSLARFLLKQGGMTAPRIVLPGDTVMVTRRTLGRRHLFRPDPAIRRLYLYSLTVCAKEFGVLVHTAVLMSTHEHLVVTDPNRRLPDFLRELHRLVSMGTKAIRQWEGPTWDYGPPSVVRLLSERAIVEKLAYVMANPVKAGLVHRARDWPGFIVLPQELGRRKWNVRRPNVYFSSKNPRWPTTVELALTVPPALEERFSAASLRKSVAIELKRQERLALQELKRDGRRVIGSDQIRRLSPHRRATSPEPRGLNPTFAVGRGQGGLFVRAVHELRAFRRAYRQALDRWRAGARAVVFPSGTWLMCRLHGVPAIE